MVSTPSVASLVGVDQEWAQSIAIGAPPFHRYRHPAFRSTRTTDGAAAAQAWRATVSGHRPGLDDEVLKSIGLDGAAVEEAFGDAVLEPDHAAPEWVECLVSTIRHLPLEEYGHSPTADSIDVATACFRDAARSLLDWDLLEARHRFLDARTLTSFSCHLATRVVMTSSAVLELENLGRTDFRWDFTRGAWRQRLTGFPGLNYVVGTGVRQWRQNAAELVSRLGADLPAIRSSLLRDRDPGPVVTIDFDLGDRHNDGRSVAALTFASGDAVVYKPKDLRCADTFLRLVDTVNAAAGELLLPSYRVLPRDGYSWEQFIPQQAVSGPESARSLFRRYGAVLRVLQLVEGRDFWIDNLRISGELPFFVDLECAFQPRIDGLGFQVRLPELDPRLYEESVLPTGAVTQPMDVRGIGRQDFGGLAGSGIRALPLGLWNGYRDRDNGNILLRDGRLFWYPEVAWPVVDGVPVPSEDYLDDIEAGYRRAQAVLERCAPRLRSPDGPLHDLPGLRVRALLRSTWEYLVLLRSSLTPQTLLSGAARETALAHVLGTAPAWGAEERVSDRMRVAWSEVEALRALDIPQFLSSPATTLVADARGETLADLFSGTAELRLAARLTDLEQFDIDAHTRILRVGVASINGAEGVRHG
ncbi:type 2 lanthipeptide synthetase LanM [Streptomyces iakyrus]|uniref:type 2 lanthipeptide synthetase LanM n=1 Tax=Streptomyces iakyrus TaxID=68219 RepID=UPI0036E1C8A9